MADGRVHLSTTKTKHISTAQQYAQCDLIENLFLYFTIYSLKLTTQLTNAIASKKICATNPILTNREIIDINQKVVPKPIKLISAILYVGKIFKRKLIALIIKVPIATLMKKM